MLKLTEIKKSYVLGEQKQEVLKGINLAFRDKEFVSILGASGSGKTTLLNIIGGLDKYDSGDLIIDGTSTKKYISKDWDSYRNHKIGFIFQSYNLIHHQTILSNVELSLTLSGISKKERKQRAKEVLIKVGLEEHIKKLPSQLSGGQMQRVAIARALVNNPDIILADEPTGALDSNTSIQIMDLLKEISKDKLVIMVTHNPELANKYSNRIIELKDGIILKDSNPYNDKNTKTQNKITPKTSMSLKTSLGLSLKNLLNKKGRTILTSIAGSIGIIGIALVLSLSNGVKKLISDLEKNETSDYPITIEKYKYDLLSAMSGLNLKTPVAEDGTVVSYDDLIKTISSDDTKIYKENNLSELKKLFDTNEDFQKYTNEIKYLYDIDLQLYSKMDDNYVKISPVSIKPNTSDSSTKISIDTPLFTQLSGNDNVLKNSYKVAAGKLPSAYNEVVLIINKDGSIPDSILYSLNIKDRSKLSDLIDKINNNENVVIDNDVIKYDDLLGKTYKMITTLDYYKLDGKTVNDYSNNTEYMNKIIDKGVDITIVGILKTDNDTNNVIGYTKELVDYILEQSEQSEITKFQLDNPDINVITGKKFNKLDNTYENNLKRLGIVFTDEPSTIELYFNNKKEKEELIKIIKDYNQKQTDDSLKINYTDTMQDMVGTVTNLIDVISYAIIGFVAISLVVSSIMIAIITYISVLERTKEIGILRAIGASKKDVVRVFRAETIIEGLISGVLGVGVALLLMSAINLILKLVIKTNFVAIIPFTNIILLILLSVLLTVIAGAIPSNMASKKNPVESLRSE